MARKRRHWVDSIADDLQERIRQTIPAVAATLKDSVPVGYKPPTVAADELDQFLNMDGSQRLAVYQQMGPEEYREFTSNIMAAAGKRYGAAAQALMPLMEAAEAQAMMAPGEEQNLPPVNPMEVARMQLAEYLGVDPMGDNYGG